MDKVWVWVRAKLGLPGADLMAQTRYDNLRRDMIAIDARVKVYHGELIGALDRIEKRLIAAHVEHPSNYTPPVLDWDTVQAIALHDLEKEPQ